MNEILKYDPLFTEAHFKSFIDNVFIQIHLAVMMKNIEKIKHYVSNEIYQKLYKQVEHLKQNNLIQMYDEINVKQTTLLDFKKEDDVLLIRVNITSRYMDYLMDEAGNFISGHNKERVEKENYLTFQKKLDAKSIENVHRCPGCGVSMDINHSGKCNYCGSTYDLENSEWILVSFEVT